MFVNVSGSFLIVAIIGLFEHSGLSNDARLFFAVGVLGGYTTFRRLAKSGACKAGACRALMQSARYPGSRLRPIRYSSA